MQLIDATHHVLDALIEIRGGWALPYLRFCPRVSESTVACF